ncbi:MAG: hypothetical protein HRU26_16955, partial [Psychroserpens sp.]|nr:hypothetical protein [Psychroserpens sp.]
MKYIILLFVSAFSLTIFSQTPEIDSLKNELNNNHADTTKVSIYLSLSAESIYAQFDKAQTYADSALSYSLRTNNYMLPQVYNNLGQIAFENRDQELARSYYDKALEELDRNDNKTARGIVYGNYSATYDNSNEFDKELEYSLKAIELNKDDEYELCFLYYNHSVIYEDAGFHDEAIYYLELARNMASRSGEVRVEAYATMNLAYDAMDNKKNYDESANYLKRVGEICDETGSAEICHYYYMTLGRLQTYQKLYDKAENSILKSIELAKQRGLTSKITESYMMLGNLEYERGNYNKAAQIFEANNIDDFDVVSMWYANLKYKKRGLLEAELGNYKRSNELLNQYVIYADSIHKFENRNLLTNADRLYKVEKKNKEIAEQQLILNEQELELQERNTQIIYMSGITIFLIVASFLTWLFFQQKQKRKNQEIVSLKQEQQIRSLEALINGEEKERSRIAKELHDGVNGDLSAIKHRLSRYQNQTGIDLSEAIKMVDDSCEDVRAISHNLIPPSLENYTLRESLSEYCMNLNETRSEQISFQYVGDNFRCSKASEVTLFRIVQELLNNSLKHAKANEILVQLTSFEDTLQLTVEDDGIGFDVNQNQSQGLGLGNIRSRVEYLNGELDIQSGK